MRYKRLTHEQRHTIDCDLVKGKNYSEIARRLNVDRSTISREVKRNVVGLWVRSFYTYSLDFFTKKTINLVVPDRQLIVPQ